MVRARDAAFPCASAAIQPKTDAVACGAAAAGMSGRTCRSATASPTARRCFASWRRRWPGHPLLHTPLPLVEDTPPPPVEDTLLPAALEGTLLLPPLAVTVLLRGDTRVAATRLLRETARSRPSKSGCMSRRTDSWAETWNEARGEARGAMPGALLGALLGAMRGAMRGATAAAAFSLRSLRETKASVAATGALGVTSAAGEMRAGGRRHPAGKTFAAFHCSTAVAIAAVHCSTAVAIAAVEHLSPPFTIVLLLRSQPFNFFRCPQAEP